MAAKKEVDLLQSLNVIKNDANKRKTLIGYLTDICVTNAKIDALKQSKKDSVEALKQSLNLTDDIVKDCVASFKEQSGIDETINLLEIKTEFLSIIKEG